MRRFVAMAKRVNPNRSPIDADYNYNCKHPFSGTCARIHTPNRKFSLLSFPLFLILIDTHTLTQTPRQFTLALGFYFTKFLQFVFFHCYHPEEHVFHSVSDSVFSLLFFASLFCCRLLWCLFSQFAMCFAKFRVLRSLFVALFSSILCIFLLCSVVANAVASNSFCIVFYFCCLHPQWILRCYTACYRMCFAACLRFNSVYLHFVCATLRPDIFVAGIRVFSVHRSFKLNATDSKLVRIGILANIFVYLIP